MRTVIEDFLRDQGWNATDIRIYLDLCKYEPSFAGSVSLRTSIDRGTVYSALKRLVRRGMIAQTTVRGTRAYVPISPKIFLDRFDREKDLIEAKKKNALVFLEEMAKIRRRSSVRPRTAIYEGAQGLINLYKRSLETPVGQQKSFLTLQKIPAELKDFLRHDFIRLKVERKVKSQVLVSASPHAEKYRALDAASNRETKIIKKHPFELHSEIILCNKNEIAIADFHESPYGILIESETLFFTLETLFEYIWRNE